MSFDRKAYMAAYYERHKVEIKARSREWAEAHPDAKKQASRECARRRYADPETLKQIRAAKKRWQQKNGVDYYIANRDRALAQKKASREKDPEKTRQQYRGYHQQPKYQAILRAAGARRRARKRGALVGDPALVRAFYLMVRTADSLPCRYCDRDLKKGERHVDHVIPLVRGGAHAVENLVVACARCNQTKQTKTASEFLGWR